MSRIVFYGLNEAGETAHHEHLPAADVAELKALARQRLADFHGVEIWDGPMCIVRLRRRAEEQA